MAGVDVRGAHTALVTIPATVNGRLIELGLPLYASGGAIVVLGNTSLASQAVGCVRAELAGGRFRSSRAEHAGESAADLLPSVCGRRPGHAEPLPHAGGLGRRARRRGELRVDRQHHRPAGRRDTRHNGDGQLGAVWPGQPGCTAAAATYDMSVIDLPGGRRYVREMRAGCCTSRWGPNDLVHVTLGRAVRRHTYD